MHNPLKSKTPNLTPEELKRSTITQHSEAYEEISEKRTSGLGYIFLILMAGFTIIAGETVFSDISDIPTKPVAPAYCISSLSQNNNVSTYLENLNYFPDYCNFGTIDSKFSIDSQFNNLKPKFEGIVAINNKIQTSQSNLIDYQNRLQDLNRNYELSLQEKIARENAIMNTADLQMQIQSLRANISSTQSYIAQLQNSRTSLIQSIVPQMETLKKSYINATDEYETGMAYYNFIVFLLKLLFVIPFFGLSLYYYFNLKKKNSPYTIIFMAILSASAILFLQIALVFLYDIIPHQWIARIFDFFMSLPFLRYFLYYGSVILIIAIFGGVVYYIQKKVFDPIKVAIRRLKENKCPGCSYSLHEDFDFCPNCGLQLKEECPFCHKLKLRYLPNCQNCGKK